MKIFTPSNQLSPVAFLVIIVIILVSILVNVLLAVQMKKIAWQKGQDGQISFFLSFFFGVFGWIYTAMLPDLVQRKQTEEILAALRDKKKEKSE